MDFCVADTKNNPLNPQYPSSSFPNLDLAIFRLSNCCALVQEDMKGFYETAGLEKIPQIDFIFSWLRKREVSICLISDYSREDTEIILRRLGWYPSTENSSIDAIILRRQLAPTQLYLMAAQLMGLQDCRTSIALADQPELLRGAAASKCLLTIGLNYGESSIREIAKAPTNTQLDTIGELPNYLLQHLSLSHQIPKVDFPHLGRNGLPF